MFDEKDTLYHELLSQLIHIVLATRFAMLTIYLIGLGKWFEKKYLYLVIVNHFFNFYLGKLANQWIPIS